ERASHGARVHHRFDGGAGPGGGERAAAPTAMTSRSMPAIPSGQSPSTSSLVAGARVVTGYLASLDQTRRVAEQVNAIGDIAAVIHNAGIYVDDRRVATPEGHARTLAVNVLAP